MKKDKINIDDFFKNYVDSLPDSNFSEEINQRLKDSIFEKVTENKIKNDKRDFLRIPKIVLSKKFNYITFTAASLLVVFSLYFLFNNESKNEVKNNIAFVNSDTTQKQSKLDTNQIKPEVDNTQFVENQIASLNYDITSRGLKNDEKDNNDDKVFKIILEEFKSNNLNYTLLNNIFVSDQFLYKEKIAKLKVEMDRDNKEITFILLSKNPQVNELELRKINPKKIKNQIEKKIIGLVEIE